ncbi:retrotransposon protein, putative, ty1-copia subclass [Tanacetum coccineum]
MVRSMIIQTTLPKSFWDYALESAARMLNMVPSKKVEKTPYEVWHGQASKLSYLKVLVCEALVKRDMLIKPDKLKIRSVKCIFVGYLNETMGVDPTSMDLEFLSLCKITDSTNFCLAAVTLTLAAVTSRRLLIPTMGYSFYYPLEIKIIIARNAKFFLESKRTRHAPDRMCLYVNVEGHELGDHNEPTNYKAALSDPESDKWLEAKNVEKQYIKDN